MPDRLEVRLRWLFRSLAVVFVVLGATLISSWSLTSPDTSPPDDAFGAGGERVARTLAAGSLVVATILAALVARAPRRHAQLMIILAVGLTTCALAFLDLAPLHRLPAPEAGIGALLAGIVTMGVAASCAGAWLALWLAPRPSAATAERDETLLRALLETTVPAGGPFALGADDAQVRARITEYFSALHRRGATGLRLALRALDFSSLVFTRRRFARSDCAAREAFLDRLARSRLASLRHLAAALKLVVTSRFYSDPRAEAAIGYDREYLSRKLRAGPNRDAHAARIAAEQTAASPAAPSAESPPTALGLAPAAPLTSPPGAVRSDGDGARGEPRSGGPLERGPGPVTDRPPVLRIVRGEGPTRP